jgi:hypothetical protein
MYVILIIAKLCYIVQNTNLKPQITQPYVEGMSNQWYPLRLAHQEHANFLQLYPLQPVHIIFMVHSIPAL